MPLRSPTVDAAVPPMTNKRIGVSTRFARIDRIVSAATPRINARRKRLTRPVGTVGLQARPAG
jgi:hypothetical protein